MFDKSYLDDVVESQGKLFDFVSQNFPQFDLEDFIYSYMKSKTRKSIDDGQAYTMTKSGVELFNYYIETENYKFKNGKTLQGFLPMWIGQFYSYYQYFYNIQSEILIDKIPLSFLEKAYNGLHDLDLDLAVKKVGKV